MIWKVIKDQKRLIVELPEDILLNGLLVEFRPKTIMVEPISYKEIILGVVILAGVNSFTNEMQNNMELFGYNKLSVRHGYFPLNVGFRKNS